MTPYQQLWSVVDGAVVDALKNHPDYLTPKGRKSARTSVVKRVTGTVLSFAVQSTARGRINQPAATPEASFQSKAGDGFEGAIPTIHRTRIGRITFHKVKSSRRLSEFNITTNRLIVGVKARGK